MTQPLEIFVDMDNKQEKLDKLEQRFKDYIEKYPAYFNAKESCMFYRDCPEANKLKLNFYTVCPERGVDGGRVASCKSRERSTFFASRCQSLSFLLRRTGTIFNTASMLSART